MRLLLLVLLAFLPHLLIAQTQSISGQIIDKDTRQPLIGAEVMVLNSEPLIGTTTDLDGNFVLPEVPVGRLQVSANYLGYDTYLSEPLILNVAKSVALQIELIETGVTGEEVIVTAFKHSNEPLNELAIVSTRSFSVEETQRYAASANDPSRMAMGFPGVQPSRDSRSDIVVRGNSGIGLLWRLEGIDIPNPNHFARRGSSGGGITVFSVSMLGNSDFSTGAFPAEYGNAFSGVFDVHLRNGNKQEREYSFRAGMLGLDLATEGPIKKGKSSYLINYRYSTLGLLNNLGIYLVNPRADNIFQDLSFKLNFSGNNKSTLSIWGIGGLSDEFERAIDDLDDSSTYSERLTRDFQSDMGALGLTHTFLIDDKSYLKSALAISGQNILFNNDTLNNEREAFPVNREAYKTNRITITTAYNRKLSNNLNFKVGVFLHRIGYILDRDDRFRNAETFILEDDATFLTQQYLQFRWRPTEKLNINLGMHAMLLSLNNTKGIDPRLGIRYNFSEKTQLSLAYGLHSRMLPIGNYFLKIHSIDGNFRFNEDLEFIKAHHAVLALDQFINKSLKIHAEFYYQYLYDVPVDRNSSSTYSLLNIIDGYTDRDLVSTGTGKNIGVDVSLEKLFREGSFMILSGSIFNSTYTDFSGRSHSGRYNSNFSATFMGGKEWNFKKSNSLQASFKLLYNAGARITPLLNEATGDAANPPFDFSRPFEGRVNPYFRPDIRVAYRKNREKTAWTLALDIQNIISRRNQDALDRIYDPEKGLWVDRVQSGLTPVLSYQLDF